MVDWTPRRMDVDGLSCLLLGEEGCVLWPSAGSGCAEDGKSGATDAHRDAAARGANIKQKKKRNRERHNDSIRQRGSWTKRGEREREHAT